MVLVGNDPLCYTTIRNTILHYTTLHNTNLHYTTLHDTTLKYRTVCYPTLHPPNTPRMGASGPYWQSGPAKSIIWSIPIPTAVWNILLTLIYLLQNQTKSLNKYGKYRGSNGATKLRLYASFIVCSVHWCVSPGYCAMVTLPLPNQCTLQRPQGVWIGQPIRTSTLSKCPVLKLPKLYWF